MKRRLLPVLALVGLALVGTARAEAPQTTLAIFPLHPLGTEPEIVERLEELVYAEMQALGTVIVVSQVEVEIAVSQLGKDVCTGAPACLAAFGRMMGADLLFFGTVASLGRSYVLDAKLVASQTGAVAGRKSVTLHGDQAVLIRGIRELAVQLVAPAQYVGALDLQISEAGAQVLVDGTVVGTSPMQPLRQLAPGQHSLRIVKEGRPDFERFVNVEFGRTTVLRVDLDRGEAVVQSGAQIGTGSTSGSSASAFGQLADLGAGWSMPIGVGGAVLGAAMLGAGALSATQLLLPWFAAQSYTRESAGGQIVVGDQAAYLEEVDRYHQAEGYWWLGVGLASAGSLLVAGGVGVLLLVSDGEPGEESAHE